MAIRVAVQAIVVAVPALAADPQYDNLQGYMVLSNGQVTCGEFLSDAPETQASDTE